MCWADERKPEMTRIRRCAVLVLLVGFWAYVSVELNPAGQGQEGISLVLTSVWLGTYFALPGLLATWTAFADQPLAVRLPLVTWLAALIGLMGTWGDIRNSTGQDANSFFLLVLLPVTGFQTIGLGLLRQRCGWRITYEGLDCAAAERDDVARQEIG